MGPIDLRSDTVTLPTDRMRRAMADAELGDDVMGEDPTVNRLQEVAAARLGKEAALLVSSGTMGNLIGILVNAAAGEEVIADADAHTFMYEAAGAAAVGGVQVRPVPTERGVMTPAQVLAAVRPPGDDHQPRTAALMLENTHNRHGGVAWPPEAFSAVAGAARERGLKVHLDGARLFNAAAATGVPVDQLAAGSDTVTFCLSKGLACPAGSILAGSAEAVAEARRKRKMLGGGMRQAGVLAAAGLVALETMVDRLAEDHDNARTLAEGLAEMPGVDCDLNRVQTDIVIVSLRRVNPNRFLEECRAQGLLAGWMGGDRVRFVTHHGITPGDIQRALEIASQVLAEAAPARPA
ncbi:MAG: GntG family PLP-dependent aldolase [Candidatus Dormibacterales bacterium]